MKRSVKVLLSVVLSFVLVEVPFALRANAGMIPTTEVISGLTQAQNREKVATFFQRQDVQKELVKFGVPAAEANQRLASLSDAEVQKMAGQIDQEVAGGDVLVISLTTVLLIVIILILLGKL